MGDLALATRGDVEQASNQSEFVNSDGTPASWERPIPRSRRWIHFALRAAPGSAFGLLIVIGQASDGNWIGGLLFGGAIILISIGWAYAHLANAKASVRQYATQFEAIPDKERYGKAAKWIAAALFLGGFFLWALLATDTLREQWGWVLACLLIFGIPGAASLTQRRRRVLTPDALKAKSYYANLEIRPSVEGRATAAVEMFAARMYKATFVRAFGRRGSRYILAVIALGVSGYLALESTSTDAKTYALLLALVGIALAWDAVLWLIGAAIAIAIFTAIFKGIAAIPVGVAIIIGALIIASSNERR